MSNEINLNIEPSFYHIPIENKKELLQKKEIDVSFKFFDRTHKAFNLAKVDSDWYITLIDTLKDFCNRNYPNLIKIPKYDYHDWNKKPPKYLLEDLYPSLKQQEQIQLRLDRVNGRIHGFFVDHIFYIVWLDPEHNMTDIEGFEPERDYPPPKTSYDLLYDELMSLREELLAKEKYISELETLKLS